jgi:hypothetical protein
MRSAIVLCFVAFLGAIALVSGWGFQGHRMTARIASNFLFPEAEVAIEKYLGGPLWKKSPNFYQGPVCYPDDYDHQKVGMWSYSLHYAYSNSFAYFDYACDCQTTCNGTPLKNGYCTASQTLTDCCVVSGISKMEDELFLEFVKGQRNPAADQGNTADPALKLMQLAHWIGDIHQPLHVDLNCDAGGNDYRVSWYGNTSCGASSYDFYSPCNLHKIWDSMLLSKRLEDYGPTPDWNSTVDDFREPIYATHLVERMALMFNVSAQGRPMQRTMPEVWATDSIMLASMSYLVDEGFNVADRYYTHALPILELQLWRAGFRIASALNYIFGGKMTDCGDCKWWPPLCRPTDNYVAPPMCALGNTTRAMRTKRASSWD